METIRPLYPMALTLTLMAGALASEISLPLRARHRALDTQPARPAIPIGQPFIVKPPLGLPPVPAPKDNPLTRETVFLGRKLFFDKVLSRDNTVSCASCHDPRHAFADPKPVSGGVNGKKGNRNAPALLNIAYSGILFWDGRAPNLEAQAGGPVENPLEMAHSLVGVERKLAASPVYVDLFAKAWGPGAITWEMAAKSIASYQRTLVSGNSRFDRYYYGGDKMAMTPSAIRGLKLYLNPSLKAANCVSCHRIDVKSSTFTEDRFHNTGAAWDPVKKTLLDLGRSLIQPGPKMAGAFRSMTLRNIARSAPYMHDGAIKTLEESIDFYFDGGRPNTNISVDMPDPGLPDIPKAEQAQAKKDLVEFMKMLDGDLPPDAVPPDWKPPQP
ncbi:MAG: cytochrome-c peroxidase [Acidobacteria bacterium]|nr:cytochrome-c peroxidase [Acidobacteriota bacterium]